MKVAIFGASGQLGRDVAGALAAHEVVAVDHDRADVRDGEQVAAAVRAARPDWVVHCAAMTNVDRCEGDVLTAFDVNALGARNVALACASAGARIVHVSTDYVFDGEKADPYLETDVPRPINIYGMSKLAGEWFVRVECPTHVTVRTSGLYGRNRCRGKGTNFVETMLELAASGGPLRVVSDERLTPTFTEDLARQIRTIVEGDPPAGVYHATNAGACSWFEFAQEIVRGAGLRVRVEPIRASDWGSRTRRPRNSVLENRALASIGLDVMPDWRDALGRYLARRSAEPAA